MNLHRKYTALCCLMTLGLVCAGEGLAAEWGSPTLSGSAGYNYRALDGDNGANSTSHQWLGSLFVNSYLGRPWIGTADLSLTATKSETSNDSSSGASTDTSSEILTGSLNLNMLPQSRSPLNLRYMMTDTRVDASATNTDAFIVLSDGDTTAERFGLTQFYTWEAGHRLRFTYDNNEWSSDRNGDYTDEGAGLELDMRGAQYHMITNAKVHEATRSINSLVNESNAFDVTHYYYPTNAFRLDTRASFYEAERSFEVPSDNDQSGVSTTESVQMSSFGFYRPKGSPWSLSGGVRLFDLSGENDGDTPQSNESKSVNATLGGFYQYNKNLRWDASTAYLTNTSNNIDTDVMRFRLGALYQSDMRIIREFTHQWYANMSGDGVFQESDSMSEDRLSANVALGHNVHRSWFMESGMSFRLSGAQALTAAYTSIDNEDDSTSTDSQRLEHTVTGSMNHSAGGGTSYAQLTLSDGRNFGTTESDQQMIWLQLNRDQRISRKSTLTGNFSLQYVNQNYESDFSDSEVTTSTAKIAYRDIAFFNVPRLGFLSDVMYSKASEEEGVDRLEWENRLDYAIGQLTTSLSHRMIEYDDRALQLTFFRIERHF